MQYVKLPKNICARWKKFKGILYGETLINLVDLIWWDVCCLPKMEGGLGMNRHHHKNDAFDALEPYQQTK
jgi:hypothetical protein